MFSACVCPGLTSGTTEAERVVQTLWACTLGNRECGLADFYPFLSAQVTKGQEAADWERERRRGQRRQLALQQRLDAQQPGGRTQ